MKTVFITGGAGFIGSELIGRMIETHKIVVFDNFSRDALKEKPYRNHANLTLVKGDVLDAKAVRESMKGAEIVIHCAAVAGINTITKSPSTTLRVNMIGSANVLEAAAELPNCERVFCFSTSEVFGSHAFRSKETDGASIGSVGESRWTYAVGKLAEEHLAIAYYTEHKLPTVVVRPFNVYGPGQVGEGAIRAFVERAVKNEPIEVHGDGSQIRAWCYVDDMVEAVLLGKAVGESFNIGNARSSCTIWNLAQTIVRVAGSTSTVKLVPKDEVDVALRIPDTRKAKDVLGFEAKVDLEEGLARTIAHFRKTLGK
jgi:UDP-glucose 4-epimerase